MAYSDIAARWLDAIPEIRLLRAISTTLGGSITIHGSVARNLLIRALAFEDGLNNDLPSFVDLIDPLGDVDLAVPNHAMVNAVHDAVFSRIGIASALQWEIKTQDEIEVLREAGATTSLDGTQISITGQAVRLQQANTAVVDLERRVLTGAIPQRWYLRRDALIAVDLSLFVLRVARDAAQFGLVVDGRLQDAISGVAREQPAAPMPRRQAVRLAVLDVLFNSRELEDAGRLLEWAREVVPALPRQHGVLLDAAYAGIARNVMHAVVYPASDVSRLVSEFHPFAPTQPSDASYQSAVPWVPVRLA